MKLRFSQGSCHSSRNERILDLAKRMKQHFPDKFHDPRLDDCSYITNGGLFTFCDDICRINPEEAAPHLTVTDLPLIYWGCNDMKWSRGIISTMEKMGLLNSMAYESAIEYSSKYFPSRDGEYFSSVGIVYGFYEKILSISHDDLQQGMRQAISANRYSPNPKKVLRYSANLCIVDNPGIYSFHNDVGMILGPDKKPLKDPRQFGPIYMDAPIGLILSYGNSSNAIITFFIESESVLMIHQIQGTNRRYNGFLTEERSPRGLYGMDWRTAMLDMAIKIADRLDMSVAILAGKNNSWTKGSNESSVHIDIAHAQGIYDAIAKKAGFVEGMNGNFYQK